MHTRNEKRRMEDELDHLTRERNDLIRRMNELSDNKATQVFNWAIFA